MDEQITKLEQELKDHKKEEGEKLSEIKDSVKSMMQTQVNFAELKVRLTDRMNRQETLHNEIMTKLNEIEKKIEVYEDVWKAWGYGRKFVIGLAITIGSIVGTVVGLKQIFSWFNTK